MWIQVLSGAVLVLVLWTLVRFALGLRFAKVAREEHRRSEEARGRRVVAEVPLEGDELVLFLEDDEGFYWGPREVRKRHLLGARMLLNGGVMASFSRSGHTLPEPKAPEEFEGRERWEVVFYVDDGTAVTVPCGTLREGVSREIATRIFDAARRSVG